MYFIGSGVSNSVFVFGFLKQGLTLQFRRASNSWQLLRLQVCATIPRQIAGFDHHMKQRFFFFMDPSGRIQMNLWKVQVEFLFLKERASQAQWYTTTIQHFGRVSPAWET